MKSLKKFRVSNAVSWGRAFNSAVQWFFEEDIVCWKMTHSALKAGNKTSGVKPWYFHSLKADSTFQKIHNKVQQVTFSQNLPIIDWIPAQKGDNERLLIPWPRPAAMLEAVSSEKFVAALSLQGWILSVKLLQLCHCWSTPMGPCSKFLQRIICPQESISCLCFREKVRFFSLPINSPT